MRYPEICIAGAGIIGLSLALELHHRGASVVVLDQSTPLSEASSAAAGMLAAADPDNPLQLRPLSNLSLSLYPAFLDHIESLTGIRVPFHTNTTLQALPPHLTATISEQDTVAPETLALLQPQLNPGDRRFLFLSENSLDPRELASALLEAVHSTSIDLRPHSPIQSVRHLRSSVDVETASGVIRAARFVDCTGAWALTAHLLHGLHVVPRKGQMLAVSLPPSLPLHLVVRTPEIYVVPRTVGPSANRAIIGATVEDAGFDKTVRATDIAHLRAQAATLLPSLADARKLEAWAGLRPATEDGLPILGLIPDHPNHFIATGHYRNGILLAPATAHVMSQILADERPSVDLAPFSPERHTGEKSNPKAAQKARYSRTSS
jgi:glycine oxidase